MKKIVLILTLLSSLIYAKGYSFTLFHTYVKEKSLTDKYCQKNSEGVDFCSESSISYPVVASRNTTLNKGVKKIIKEYIQEFKKGSAKEEVITTLREMPEASLAYESQMDIKLYALTKKTFTLSVSSYVYQGGAHGNHNLSYFNYNIKTLKEIGLDDILKQGYSKRLKKIAEKAYRESNNYMPKENLTDLGWFENKFILTDNYAITSRGLEFLYNPYEIKPHIAGITTFVLPYNRIISIMKSDK